MSSRGEEATGVIEEGGVSLVVESAEGSEILGLAEKDADFGGRRCVGEERLRGVVVTVGEDGKETALEEGVERDVLGGGETGEGGEEADGCERERGREYVTYGR